MKLERVSPHRFLSRAALRYLDEEAGERVECYLAELVPWRVVHEGDVVFAGRLRLEVLHVPEMHNLQTVIWGFDGEEAFHAVWNVEHERTLEQAVASSASWALRRCLGSAAREEASVEVDCEEGPSNGR